MLGAVLPPQAGGSMKH